MFSSIGIAFGRVGLCFDAANTTVLLLPNFPLGINKVYIYLTLWTLQLSVGRCSSTDFRALVIGISLLKLSRFTRGVNNGRFYC